MDTRIGKHDVRLEPPSLAVMIFHGDITADDMRAIGPWLRRVTEERGPLLILSDVGALGDIPADARRALIERGDWIPCKALAICRAGFRARVVLHILIATMKLVSKGTLGPVRFFEAEPEARAWLEGLRRGD